MNVISLRKKRPQHQSTAGMRRAIQKMNGSLEKQRASVGVYRHSIAELKEVMIEMREHMLAFNHNLGEIHISKLGSESRKLSKILANAVT